jgi:3-deoxy-D-manno-octulosonic-acid transferase
MRWLRTITTPLTWFAEPVVRFAYRNRPEALAGWGQRVGNVAQSEARCTVFCCASVGEVNTAAPLIRKWRELHPDDRILVATSSAAGRNQVLKSLEGVAEGALQPLDLGDLPGRWFDRVRPTEIVLVETELWPLFLDAASSRSIPVRMVSGRLSDKNMRTYLTVRPLYRSMLKRLQTIGAQSPKMAARFGALGADPDKVFVTGNLKFASVFNPPVPTSEFVSLYDRFRDNGRVIVAGSTHTGEDKAIAGIFRNLVERFPDLRLVIAPRHTRQTRIDEVVQELEAKSVPFTLRSRVDAQSNLERVLVLDTKGELAHTYQTASAAFVGNSLNQGTGHNVLEPAAAGAPVLFGPHTDDFADEARLLLDAGGAVRVANTKELEAALLMLLTDPEKSRKMGKLARNAVSPHRDVVGKTMSLLNREAAK